MRTPGEAAICGHTALRELKSCGQPMGHVPTALLVLSGSEPRGADTIVIKGKAFKHGMVASS